MIQRQENKQTNKKFKWLLPNILVYYKVIHTSKNNVDLLRQNVYN